MKAIYNDFSRSIESFVPDSSLRSRIIAAAIASAAVNLSPLPSSQLDSPSNHFNTTVLPEIRNIISEFNENVVFDCRLAVEYAQAFWMVRYSAAHPSQRPCYAPSASFFDALSCVGTYVSPDLLCFLNENSGPILSLSSVAASVICALRD